MSTVVRRWDSRLTEEAAHRIESYVDARSDKDFVSHVRHISWRIKDERETDLLFTDESSLLAKAVVRLRRTACSWRRQEWKEER